jgi:hypothetical protein
MRLKLGEYYFVELGWFGKRWQLQFLVKITGFSPKRCLYDLLACSENTKLNTGYFLYHHHHIPQATIIKRVRVKQLPLYMYMPYKTCHFDEVFSRSL